MDYKKIDTQELNRMLLGHIRELEQEGFVDHHFQECHSLKEDSGLSFFLDLIPVFFADVSQVVKELANALNQPVVNFREIYSQFIKLKGCSSCFGACRVRDACSNLHQAIENKSKEGCIQALNSINDECKSLQERLDGVVKLKEHLTENGCGWKNCTNGRTTRGCYCNFQTTVITPLNFPSTKLTEGSVEGNVIAAFECPYLEKEIVSRATAKS